jgi:hypothetical protein
MVSTNPRRNLNFGGAKAKKKKKNKRRKGGHGPCPNIYPAVVYPG